MPENFCSGVFLSSSISRLLYLWHTYLNNKYHIMVLRFSGHNMVAWRRMSQLPRVNSLILRSTIKCWWREPTRSSLYVVHRYAMPSWTGSLQILCFPPYRSRPRPRGCLTSNHMINWPGGFPRMRFPSWGDHIISQSSGPKIQCTFRILCGLYPQWLLKSSLVGQIPYGWSRSCPWV